MNRSILFALRNLKKSPLLAAVGIPGLVVGLAAVMLLVAYVTYEFSYDQHFDTKDRVLRVKNRLIENEQTSISPICHQKTLPEVLANVPGVEAGTRIYRGWEVDIMSGERKFAGMELIFADPGFFDVFAQPMIAGNPAEALHGSSKVVLTRNAAMKIFGTVDCVGEPITVNYQKATVSGVVEDLPQTSHFGYDLVASMETIRPERFPGLEFFTYVLLQEQANQAVAAQQIARVNDRVMEPWCAGTGIAAETETELLANIHMHSNTTWDISPKADMTAIITVVAVGLFTLLIALVNYLNLYVLHGERRIGEIATRRSFGATQGWLARLFYSDAILIGLIAFIGSMALVYLGFPWFAHLMGAQMQWSSLFSIRAIIVIVLIVLLVISVSGAYPLFYLSKLDLIHALKGKTADVKRKNRMSVISLLMQFAITIFLVGSLLVMHSQISFLKDRPLGFDAKPVLRINSLTPAMKERMESIRMEIEKLPFVDETATSFHGMGFGCSGQIIKKYGSSAKEQSINEYRVQPGFASLMNLKLTDGRYFTDTTRDRMSVILNQTAVDKLGGGITVGEQFDMGHGAPMELIGIVDDFYYNGHTGEPIGPLAITLYDPTVRNLYVRNKNRWTQHQREQMADVLQGFDDTYTFNAAGLQELYNQKYSHLERTMGLVSAGTVLAIVLSLSGLVALSLMNVNRRTKEIGVRKVLGSEVHQVVITLMKDTLKWIVLSALIAFVAIYYFMHEWLSAFVNKITLSPQFFLLSALVVFVFAWLAITWQTWRAASRNPVEALRYE